MPAKIDANANTTARFRRNFQRLARGGANTTIKTTAPLLNTSGTLSLTLLGTGGLQVSSNSLSLKLVDTSFVLAAGGVGVNLAANSGLSIAAGLKLTNPTTKGDLLGFDTAPNRVPIGTNGQVLTADSAAALGLKWGTPIQLLTHTNTLNGNAVVSTAAETTVQVSAANQSFQFAANFFAVGKTVQVRASFSVANTGTPTLQIKAKLGTVIVADTGAVTTPALAAGSSLILEFELSGQTTGATGTVMGSGYVTMGTSSKAFRLNSTATIDTTVAETLTLTVQWGASSASNTITFETWDIVSLN